MIVNHHSDWETEEETTEEEEELSNNDGESVEEEELLIARKTFSIQMIEEENNQKENLFHTRCLIQNKVCSVIIEGGSCSNVASVEFVEKLNLFTLKHNHPYRLQWLNKCGEMKLIKQVKAFFSIGKYRDEVLCDTVPMKACHLLLGRPWQYDKRVTHDGFLNHYSFVLRGELITLFLMSLKQILENQIKREKKRKSESKKEYQKEESENKSEKKLEKKMQLRGKKDKKEKLKGKGENEENGKKSISMAKKSEIKQALFSQQNLLVLEAMLNINDLTSVLPSVVVSLFQEYEDLSQ